MVFAAEKKNLSLCAKYSSTPRESSVQTHCSRVYIQSQRHFNLSPRYLICRIQTLEGPRTEKSMYHYWAGQGSHSGSLYRCRRDGGEVEDWRLGRGGGRQIGKGVKRRISGGGTVTWSPWQNKGDQPPFKHQPKQQRRPQRGPAELSKFWLVFSLGKKMKASITQAEEFITQ